MDRIRNGEKRKVLEIYTIEDNVNEYRARWLEHVQSWMICIPL